MKKHGILHPAISHIIAQLGHTDTLVIADAGLPIPNGPLRIDLALAENLPPFMPVFQHILAEVQIEAVTLAEEMTTVSPALYEQITRHLGEIPITQIPHETFKELTAHARAIIRTGEFTPYANVILHAGVVF